MKLALLAGFLMLLGLAGILVTSLLHVHDYTSWEDNRTDYAIILDAGSTETRAYIYTWSHKTDKFPLPSIVIATDDENGPVTKKVKPGLATFAGNTAYIKDYLQPIVEWAHDQIDNLPYASVEETNIYLMGTGGMRELSSTDSGAVLSAVSTVFLDSGFHYNTAWASVLPGEMEAFYGFISVNALYDNFDDNQDQENTYGCLDMGGVSAEIGFVPSGTPPVNYSITQDINGTRYTVYVQSEDGLGLHAARYAYNVSLYIAQNSQPYVYDPCLPSNFTENVTTMVNGVLTSFTLIGSSNPDSCVSSISDFVTSLTQDLQKPTIGDTTFVVSDKYIKVKDFYNLEDNANIVQLRAAAGSFCSLNYEDALSHHPDFANEVPHYCFAGNYIVYLLTNFYGFDPTTRHILWKDTIRSSPVSWTLGAIVDLVIATPADFSPPDPTHHHTRFLHTDTGVVIMFISILVFLLGMVLLILQRKRDAEYTLIGSSS